MFEGKNVEEMQEKARLQENLIVFTMYAPQKLGSLKSNKGGRFLGMPWSLDGIKHILRIS